jgi:chromosome segregation ATPase
MSRSRQAVGVLIVALFGLWGCSRAPSADGGSNATAEKLKAVETKLARLEDDFRSAASARDQLSKKLIAAEEARTALQGQVAQMTKEVKEKDEQLAARTAERDQVSGQHKVLKEGLKDLLSRMEPEVKPDGSPMVPIIPTSNTKPEVPNVPTLPVVPMPPK